MRSNTEIQNSFKTVVRCRPTIRNNLNGQETKQVLFIDESKRFVEVQDPFPPSQVGKKQLKKIFSFDKIFGPEDGQDKIYSEIGQEVIESALQGYNGTIFAYGFTSTGKTHTMQGQNDNFEQRGIIPRACEQIFEFIENNPQIEFIVRVSYLELYNENITDLLQKSKKNLEIREKPEIGVFVENLTSQVVRSKDEILQQMKLGIKNRFISSTVMNSDSTRGHSIFQIIIQKYDSNNIENILNVGVLNLVDLSGSERFVCVPSSNLSSFKETVKINQSLTMLGNVISALTNPKTTHIPYRNSKLTRLLQNSLGGNSKTIMISTVGMNDRNVDETLNTLRFSERAKMIQNIAKVNKINKKEIIQSFREEYSFIRESRKSSISSFTIVDKEENKSLESENSFIHKLQQQNEQSSQQDFDNEYEVL